MEWLKLGCRLHNFPPPSLLFQMSTTTTCLSQGEIVYYYLPNVLLLTCESPARSRCHFLVCSCDEEGLLELNHARASDFLFFLVSPTRTLNYYVRRYTAHGWTRSFPSQRQAATDDVVDGGGRSQISSSSRRFTCTLRILYCTSRYYTLGTMY